MGSTVLFRVILIISCSIASFAIGNNAREVTNDTCLKAAVATFEPFTLVRGHPGSQTFHVSGVMVDVVKIFGDKLGRCIEFKRSRVRGTGFQLPNGSWQGALGLISNGEADFSGSIMALNNDRIRAFDFSTPVIMDDMVLAHKWPGIQSDMNGVFKPFSPLVWLCFGFMLLLACFVTIAIQRGRIDLVYKTRMSKINEEDEEGKEGDLASKEGFLRTLWKSCFWTLGAIIAQPCTWDPKGDSIKVMTGLWLLLSLVINTVYKSNLKAMLILPKVKLPFDSLEELVESRIKTYISAKTIVYQLMMESPTGTTLNRLQQQAVYHFDYDRATRETLDGKQGVIVAVTSIRNVLHKVFKLTGKCPPLYTASETFIGARPICMAFPKGSPLLPKIDLILMRLKEHGILNFMINKAMATAAHCETIKIENISRSLELEDFYGVFLIFFGGVFLSIVAFAIEKYSKKGKHPA